MPGRGRREHLRAAPDRRQPAASGAGAGGAGVRARRERAHGPAPTVGRGLRRTTRWRSPRSWPTWSLTRPTIAAALLHDTVEDTRAHGGRGGARVRPGGGAPRRRRHQACRASRFRSDQQLQAENIRKMMLAMAEDLRVVLIKLADRLHNMRTLDPAARDEAPRDRARDPRHLRAARPPARHRADQVGAGGPGLPHARARRPTRTWSERVNAQARTIASRWCRTSRDPRRASWRSVEIPAEITGRPKHIYSIWQKMTRDHRDFSRDLRPVRDPGPGRLGEGLLRRPRHRPLRCGSRCRGASRTTSRCRSRTGTSRSTRR